jgi:hypothetical protein
MTTVCSAAPNLQVQMSSVHVIFTHELFAVRTPQTQLEVGFLLRTQYISANINLPSQDHLLSLHHQSQMQFYKKSSRGLYRQWDPHDIHLRNS